jgi:SAM-dependent methyltransferase
MIPQPDSASEARTGIARASYDPAHFRRLFDLEARSFWFRGRSRLIEWAVAIYFPSARDLLEVGCGTGYVLDRLHRAFPHLALHGSELFPEGLAFARERLGDAASLHEADATALAFRERFDIVCAFDVIEHIEDDRRVLDNLHGALRAGGGLLLTVPQHAWLWSATDGAACHARRYARRDLRAKLEDAGFEILRMTSFVSLLLPAMLLARRRKRDGMAEVEAELGLPASLNAIARATLSIESFLIRHGVDLPAGGSLLVVARRSG